MSFPHVKLNFLQVPRATHIDCLCFSCFLFSIFEIRVWESILVRCMEVLRGIETSLNEIGTSENFQTAVYTHLYPPMNGSKLKSACCNTSRNIRKFPTMHCQGFDMLRWWSQLPWKGNINKKCITSQTASRLEWSLTLPSPQRQTLSLLKGSFSHAIPDPSGSNTSTVLPSVSDVRA